MQNVQSIAPSFNPVASPQVDDPDPQGTLHVGPTGRLHRGPAPRTKAELEDNREYLRVAGQVDFGPSKHVLSLVWMAVAYYASLQPCRTCYARVDTLAKKAKGVSPRTVQRKLHELAGLGYISTSSRSGGYRSTYWDVHLDPAENSAPQISQLAKFDTVSTALTSVTPRRRHRDATETPTACHPPPRQRVTPTTTACHGEG